LLRPRNGLGSSVSTGVLFSAWVAKHAHLQEDTANMSWHEPILCHAIFYEHGPQFQSVPERKDWLAISCSTMRA
jgi:hypothetical protein